MRIRFLLTLLWIVAIAASLSAHAEAPVVLHLGKSGAEDVMVALPSEKVMILVVFLAQIIWGLMSYVWKSKEKRENKSEEKLDRLYKMVHDLQADVKTLGAQPSEDDLIIRLQPHIELGVLRAIKKFDEHR